MKVKIIDLSQEIYNDMPVYPGHQRTTIFNMKTHEETILVNKTGYSSITMGLLMSDHGPTHVDAETHIDPSPDAKSIDQIPLEKFYTEAICLDVSHIRGEENYITKEVLEKALEESGLEIKEGDTVLLYTGHYNRTYPDYGKWLFDYPGLDREATEWLCDKGVVNVGVDAPSIDSSIEMKRKKYPAHTVCKERKLLNAENLANLDKVVGKRFIVSMLPLKIRGASGAPVRAVAIFNEE
ncbi:MAG: cyclase family protein [Clostridiales bacterium]|nr:cyclase family protein [Clostridiales bacterium]